MLASSLSFDHLLGHMIRKSSLSLFAPASLVLDPA